MKKIIFMAIVAFGCCLVACESFKSKEVPLNDELCSFTVLGEDNDTLTGVKNSKTGEVIIKPQPLDSICVMTHVLAVYQNEEIKAYTLKGKLLSEMPFCMFNETVPYRGDTPFYHGYWNTSQVLYFPLSEEFIETKKFFIGIKHIFVENKNGTWLCKDINGLTTWSIENENDLYLVKDISASKETFYIGLKARQTEGIDIFTPNGEKIKTIPSARWKKALKKKQRSTMIGKANYIEFPNFSKI